LRSNNYFWRLGNGNFILNVILAGKNVGASAVAYSSARIQANTSLAAEVIGVILGKQLDTGKLLLS
jgi:hypothetical protein